MTTPHIDDDFGPWIPVLCDDYGFCYDTVEEVLEVTECMKIKVVKGSATPTPKDGGIRCPGYHLSSDVLYEVDAHSHDEDDVEMLWARAKRVALAMNEYESKLRKEVAQS